MRRPRPRRLRLLRTGVTGIVCASDPMALGTIRAARRAGLRVPEDLSVVGFDDSALMNCTDPPLTTVRQPIEPMGRIVTELLVAQIAGAAVPPDELLFEPELVVRGSTGAVPGASGLTWNSRAGPGRSRKHVTGRLSISRLSSVNLLQCSVVCATLPPDSRRRCPVGRASSAG